MARPARFELATFGFVDRRSIRLSYGRVAHILNDLTCLSQIDILRPGETFSSQVSKKSVARLFEQTVQAETSGFLVSVTQHICRSLCFTRTHKRDAGCF